MKSIYLRIITYFFVLFCAINSFAQNVYTIEHQEPTCPDPSNGSITFTVENNETNSETYSFVIISVFENNKTILNKTVTVDGNSSYSYTADNLDYQYYDAVAGVMQTEIQYIAYISNGVKTLQIEPNINFKKPEYSATTALNRDAGCKDQAIGQASVSFNLGVPPYSWDWYKIGDATYPKHNNAEQVTDLDSGKYYVTVTDFAGCKINSDTVEVKTIDIKINAAVVKNIVCKEEKDGQAQASITNAYKNNCAVTWIGYKSEKVSIDATGNASSTNENLPAGDIYVTVEDEIGCQDTTKVEISEPEIKMTLSEVHTDLLCRDEPTGTITCTPTNATGTVTYEWSDDKTITSASRTDLPADIPFTITATDELGCQATTTATLTQPTSKVTISITNGKEPSCFGYSDGEITAEATGGDIGNFTYYWNSTNGNATNSNIPAGEYEVVAKDANGCSDTTKYTLNEPPSMEPKVFIDNIEQSTKTLQCNGETATIEVKTNDLYSPKTYNWGDGEYNTTTKKTNVTPGTYDITIRANNGCEEKVTASLIEPEKLNISITEKTPILCNGNKGELLAEVIGGSGTYTYNWSHGATGKSSGQISEGTYTVIVTDTYGCSTTASKTLSQPDSLKMKIELSPETCTKASNGELSITKSGGTGTYTYNWEKKKSKGTSSWSTISSNESISSLEASYTYKLTITDESGCVAKDSVDLSQIATYRIVGYQMAAVSCPVTIDNSASDANTNNGQLLVGLMGGFQPYFVSISTTEKSTDFADIRYGIDSGKHWNSLTSYSSLGSPLSARIRLDSLSENTYTTTATDYRGCVKKITTKISHTKEMSISILSQEESACSFPTGKAHINVTGGKAFTSNGKKYYEYSWDNGEDTAIAVNLSAGEHIVKVTDASGCIQRDTITINPKSALRIKAVTDDDKIHCTDGKTGKASAYAYYEGDDATHTYSFSWSGGDFNSTTGNVTNLSKGTYTVTVTDDEGCTNQDSVTFTEDELLTIGETTKNDILCHGENTGQIIIKNVTGGDAPYNYQWNNGGTTSILNELSVGTYDVTISDASGCQVDTSFTIIEPELLSSTITETTSETCPGNADGTATIAVLGGTGAYTISWDNVASTTLKKENLAVGSYSVFVEDENGCKTSETSFEINKKATILGISSYSITEPKCGELIGAISVVANGSETGDYFYSWTENGTLMAETTPFLTGLKIGAYKLTITDGICSYDTTFVLTAKDSNPAIGEFTYIESTCEGDSYSITISNEATAEYSSYEWRNNAGVILSTTKTATHLPSGTYTISAIDKTGCSFITSYNLVQKQLSVSVSATDAICYGNTDGTLSAKGNEFFKTPITYTWYNAKNNQEIGSGSSLSGIGIGTYYVKAYDANHSTCPIQSEQVVISQPDSIIAIASIVEPSYCKLKNGTIAVDIVNGTAPYTYNWQSVSDGVSLQKETQSATKNLFSQAYINETFKVTITDANGCSAKAQTTISDISNFAVEGYLSEPVHCTGDASAALQAVTINGYEPFTYSWSHNSSLHNSLAENLSAGNYAVTVTDAKGCSVSYNFETIEDAKSLIVEVIETPEIICNGSVGNLFARIVDGKNTPYTYQWFSNSNDSLSSEQELEDVKAGEYAVQATDKYGCTSAITKYELKDPKPLQAEFSYSITECGANSEIGIVSLDTVYGGLSDSDYRFQWISNDVASAWYDYSDSTKRTLSNLPAGKYICIVTNATDYESCYITDTLYTNPIMPMEIETAITNTHCSYYTNQEDVDGAIEITNLTEAKGDYTSPYVANLSDYTYTWNDNKNQTGTKANQLAMDSYEVTITGKNGCSKTFGAGTINAQVTLDGQIIATEDGTINHAIICLEDSLELSAKTTNTFADGYVPASTNISYSWDAIEDNRSATITTPHEASTMVNPLTTYYNDSTKISMTYSIDGCSSKPTYYRISHYDSVAFDLEVYDSLGVYQGEDSLSVIKDLNYLITPKEEPWFVSKTEDDGVMSISWHSFTQDLFEKGALRDTTTDESSYIRSGNYGIYIPCRESNYYTAVATTKNGCRQRATIYVEVHLFDIIPSGFSPNGDGINDTWIVPQLINCPNAKVTIFNRWGVQVYENSLNYYDHPWNGTSMNGNQLPMGTYYYVIEYNDSNKTPTSTGSVSILR